MSKLQSLVLPLGKYFAIRSILKTELVLEVKDGSDEPGTSVVLNEEAPLFASTGDDHQLWFYDAQTQTIRSKVNQFCLDIGDRDSRVVVRPIQSDCPTQKWILSENVIQTKDDANRVVSTTDLKLHAPIEVRVRVKVNEPESTGQQWNIDFKPASFFHIRNHDTSKVLDVHKADPRPGSKVVARKDKADKTTQDSQLWYEDRTGIIRSKLNSLVFDSSGQDIVLCPSDDTKDCRQWTVAGNSIQNRSNPSLVLEMRQPTTKSRSEAVYSLFVSQQTNSNPSQFWTFDQVPETSAIQHRGCGKHFIVRSHVSGLFLRAKDGPGSTTSLVVTGDGKDKETTANDPKILFFLDSVTGTIRNGGNNFCLDISDDGSRLTLCPYDPYKKTQQWSIHGRKILCRQQSDLVLTLDDREQESVPEKSVSAEIDRSSENQFWDIAYQPAKCFYIVSRTNSKVVAVKDTGQRSRSKVILCEKKPKVEEGQLWYEDEHGIVRSKLNLCVIEASTEKDSVVCTKPWNPSNKNHQWLIVGNCIQNKLDDRIVLEVRRKNKAVCANRFTGDENQRWTFEYV